MRNKTKPISTSSLLKGTPKAPEVDENGNYLPSVPEAPANEGVVEFPGNDDEEAVANDEINGAAEDVSRIDADADADSPADADERSESSPTSAAAIIDFAPLSPPNEDDLPGSSCENSNDAFASASENASMNGDGEPAVVRSEDGDENEGGRFTELRRMDRYRVLLDHETGQSPIECLVCRFRCDVYSKMKAHLEIHNEKNTHLCPLCNRGYKRLNDMNHHMKVHHKITYKSYIEQMKVRESVLGDMKQAVESSSDEQLMASQGSGSGSAPVKNVASAAAQQILSTPLFAFAGAPAIAPSAVAATQAIAPAPTESQATVSLQTLFPGLLAQPQAALTQQAAAQQLLLSQLQMPTKQHQETPGFSCDQCGLKFESLELFALHRSLVHPGVLTTTAGSITTEPPKSITTVDSTLHHPGALTPVLNEMMISPPVVGKNQSPSHKLLKCPHCAYSTSVKADFQYHLKTHSSLKPFHCLFCAYVSRWRCDCKNHMRKHHSDRWKGDMDLLNTYMREVNNNAKDLIVRQKSEISRLSRDPNALASPSSGAEVEYDRDLDFDEHMFDENSDTGHSDGSMVACVIVEPPAVCPRKAADGLFHCPKCRFTARFESKMHLHISSHNANTYFMCSICSFRSKDKDEVNSHAESHHKRHSRSPPLRDNDAPMNLSMEDDREEDDNESPKTSRNFADSSAMRQTIGQFESAQIAALKQLGLPEGDILKLLPAAANFSQEERLFKEPVSSGAGDMGAEFSALNETDEDDDDESGGMSPDDPDDQHEEDNPVTNVHLTTDANNNTILTSDPVFPSASDSDLSFLANSAEEEDPVDEGHTVENEQVVSVVRASLDSKVGTGKVDLENSRTPILSDSTTAASTNRGDPECKEEDCV